jgi:hypothetical protein
VGNAISALVVTLCLVIDKFVIHFLDKHHDKESRLQDKFYLKALNSVTTLIHTLSDQTLVACSTLLFTLSQQACTISAYHYNLVCLMLVIGIITHLNTLISVPDFFTKGKVVATYRIILIIWQITMTGVALSARHHTNFPIEPSGLGALPAVCFANANASADAGYADLIDVATNITTGITSNTTSNATQVFNNAKIVTKGMGAYITLMVFGLFALITLIGEWISETCAAGSLKSRKHPIAWFSIFISIASLLASIAIVVYNIGQYNTLVGGMEIPKWYQTTVENKWTFSQYMPILLLASASIPLMESLSGTLTPFPVFRYVY